MLSANRIRLYAAIVRAPMGTAFRTGSRPRKGSSQRDIEVNTSQA